MSHVCNPIRSVNGNYIGREAADCLHKGKDNTKFEHTNPSGGQKFHNTNKSFSSNNLLEKLTNHSTRVAVKMTYLILDINCKIAVVNNFDATKKRKH